MASKNEQKIQNIVNALASKGIIASGGGATITGNQIASTIRAITKRTSITSTDTTSAITYTAERGYYPNNVSSALTKYTGASTIIPSAGSITLQTQNKYVPANLTIRGDTNLIPGNIRSGVTIFGVSGTYSGSRITTVRGTFRSTLRDFTFTATNYDQQTNQIDLVHVSSETLTYSGIIQDSIVVFINNTGTAPPYYNNGLVLLNSSAQTAPRVFYFRAVSNFTIEM